MVAGSSQARLVSDSRASNPEMNIALEALFRLYAVLSRFLKWFAKALIKVFIRGAFLGIHDWALTPILELLSQIVATLDRPTTHYLGLIRLKK